MAEQVNTEVPENKIKPEVDELEKPEEVLDEPLLEPEGLPDETPDNKDKDKIHPLKPGGRRFEQVYAEGKQAKRDFVKERELRIAAEARADALLTKNDKTQTPTEDVEYTWPQLEEFITQGRITRADAEAHREQIITKHVMTKVAGDFTRDASAANHSQTLQAGINEYLNAVPEIRVEGSEARERIEEEFQFQISVRGLDVNKLTDADRRAIQLTALRTVHGPIDALVKRTERPKGETHQGLPGGARPSVGKNPDQTILDSLTKTQVEHYNKMFRSGRYPGKWKDVVAELKYDPKAALTAARAKK